jgi:hypothetical protein
MVLISHEDLRRFLSAQHERRESTRYNSGCPNPLIFFNPLSNTKKNTKTQKRSRNGAVKMDKEAQLVDIAGNHLEIFGYLWLADVDWGSWLSLIHSVSSHLSHRCLGCDLSSV